MEMTITDRVEKVIAEQIRPSLKLDGGDIELVSVEDGTVKVRLQGACQGCPSAKMTLQFGVEQRLKDEIPEVKEVVSIP